MKKKLLLFIVAVSLLSLFAISVSAMEINDNYVAENGDYEMHWVYGDSAYVGSGSGAKNIAKYEAKYLSTDGATKDGVFYANTSMYNGSQVFNGLYVPNDYDFTQLTVLPDVYVIEDGTTRNIEMFSGDSGGTQFYTSDEYAGELTFTNSVERNDTVEAFTYSKYTTLFAQDTFAGRNNLKTVTYNGKKAVDGTFFVSPTVQEFAQGAFGAGNNDDANNIKVLYFEDRGEDDLVIGRWSFARGAVEILIFGSGDYKIATYDTIGYFYNSSGATLKEIVICSGAKINQSTGKEVGNDHEVIYVGTEAEWQTERYNFRNHIPTVFNPCYFTGHQLVIGDVNYADGYSSKGEKVLRCAICAYEETIEAPALFTSLGYSTSETDGTGISIGYRVDYDAIKTYEELTGIELSYGMFATTKQAVGNGDIFDKDGNTVSGAITLDVTKSGFTFLSLKMVGFDTEESKAVEFAIGAYAITTLEGEKSYSYLQEGTPLENQKYAFIKYSDYVK